MMKAFHKGVKFVRKMAVKRKIVGLKAGLIVSIEKKLALCKRTIDGSIDVSICLRANWIE